MCLCVYIYMYIYLLHKLQSHFTFNLLSSLLFSKREL